MTATVRAMLVLAFATAPLYGCGGSRSVTKEYIDPQTAVTVRAVAAPSIYAHDVPALAANVRDYVSIAAVELNNMGGRKHYLAVIAWSTIDRKRTNTVPATATGTLRFSLGSAARELAPTTRDPRSIGVGLPLFRPATGYLGETWYAVTVSDLRLLAAAAPATLELVDGETSVAYTLWKDATPALADFVRDIPETLTPAKKRPR